MRKKMKFTSLLTMCAIVSCASLNIANSAFAIDYNNWDGNSDINTPSDNANFTGTSYNHQQVTADSASIGSGSLTNDGNFDTNTFTVNASTSLINSSGGNIGAIGDVVNNFINSGNIENSGNIFVNELQNDSSFTNSVQSAVLNATKITNTDIITNKGQISVGNLINNDKTIEGTGSLTIITSGSSSGEITQNNITTSGMFENTGEITANDTFNNSGTFTGDTGKLTIVNGENTGSITQDEIKINYKSGKKFVNKDAITVNTLTNNGVLSNEQSATIDVKKITNSRQIDNNGTINVEELANTKNIEGIGNITISKGGSSSGKITQNNITISDDFVNTGAIISNGTFTNSAEITGNSGSIKVKNGTNTGSIQQDKFEVTTGNFVNEESIKVNTLNNNGILTNLSEGNGIIETTSGTNNGTINQGVMNINSADNKAFTNNNIMNIQNELNNAGQLNNNKTLFVQNTTNDALLNNTGVLTSTGASIDDRATIIADNLVNDNAKINLDNTDFKIVYQADDINGEINIVGSNAKSSVTNIMLSQNATDVANFAGTLNVGKANSFGTMNLHAGNILENASVNINSASVLNLLDENTSLVLNENDTFNGDLNLRDGDILMKNVNYTTGDISTTAGGVKPYYTQTGGNLTLENTTLTMGDSSLISGGNLLVDTNSVYNSQKNGFTVDNLSTAGLINATNNWLEDYTVHNNFVIGNNTGDNQADFMVDLYARTSHLRNRDTFGSNTAIISAGNGEEATINVSDWHLVGDIYGWNAPLDRDFLMDEMFKGTIADGHKINFTSTSKETFTPIGWYKLNSLGGGHYSLNLTRFNPGVFRGQIATLAQYQNQLTINDMIFNHVMLDQGFKGNDYISSNPNLYASANDLYPPYQYSRKDGGLWVKMYGNFEKLQMSQGLNVGNNAYGTIIGADFGLKDLKHGWQFMPTAYISYNGGHQYWNGYGSYQNGGQLGFLGTWYKNNFMLGTMLYGGIYGNYMDTPRGTDDAFNYFAGASTRAAYNWRFARNWALQPNLLVAYNYFGQENWHSAFGQMDMMSGMLHGVNIAPGLNLIYERETFSIYGTMQYMYNINQSVSGRAGNVGLPNLSMNRGYMQYGLGINKQFTDRFSGYFQGILRNVGRNGIGLQMGFNYKIGKASKNTTSKSANAIPTLSVAKVDIQANKN